MRYWVPFLLAAAVSSVASYFLLRRQREAFATRVSERAERAAQAVERSRTKED